MSAGVNDVALVRSRRRISFQVDWDKIVTVPRLDPRGRMGWNGVELQGGAGGSVTDRPTDRLYHVWRKSKAKKEEGQRETQKGSPDTLFQKWYSSRYLRSRNSILKRISFAPGGRADDKEEGRRYYRRLTPTRSLASFTDTSFRHTSRHAGNTGIFDVKKERGLKSLVNKCEFNFDQLFIAGVCLLVTRLDIIEDLEGMKIG